MTPDVIAQGIALFFLHVCEAWLVIVAVLGFWLFLSKRWADKSFQQAMDRANNIPIGRVLSESEVNQAILERPRISTACTPVIPRGAHALAKIRP
jgi:hypothetical protein